MTDQEILQEIQEAYLKLIVHPRFKVPRNEVAELMAKSLHRIPWLLEQTKVKHWTATITVDIPGQQEAAEGNYAETDNDFRDDSKHENPIDEQVSQLVPKTPEAEEAHQELLERCKESLDEIRAEQRPPSGTIVSTVGEEAPECGDPECADGEMTVESYDTLDGAFNTRPDAWAEAQKMGDFVVSDEVVVRKTGEFGIISYFDRAKNKVHVATEGGIGTVQPFDPAELELRAFVPAPQGAES